MKWDKSGDVLLRCEGTCECHYCCVPYEGEDGPHCEDCDPGVKEPCEVCGLMEEGEHFDQTGDWCDGAGGRLLPSLG